MSVNTPPTEDIPIFDPSVFPSANGSALTVATGSKYFLTYPVAQGSEIFPSNITLQSTLSDSSGDVGISGQFLSSTGTGTNWAYAGLNGYILYDLSSLPFTLPTTTYSNLYVLFEGTIGSGGILTIPISGFTTGTFLSIKNASSGTVNISTTSIPFTTASTSTGLYDLSQSETLSLYFNGSYWIQTSISNKVYRLTVTNSISFPGSINVNTIIQSSSGQDISLYGTTTTNDILIGETLPATKTVRLCNTTAGSSGGSVKLCNVGFDASDINNATAPTTGLLRLCNSQTTGELYIGCGSATATRTSGPIFIGADSTASGGINIGTDSDLTVPAVNTINIGSSGGYATIVKGTLTSNGILTAPSVIAPSFNASADATTVGISTTQTTGALNIGTGVRTGTGLINIGGGATAAASINIGQIGTTTGTTTVNIGTSTSGNHPINIGSSSSDTNVIGDLTVGTGITITSGGLDITAGGIDIISGGISVTAGGIDVSSGGLSSLGTTSLNSSGTNNITIGNTSTPASSLSIISDNGREAGGIRLVSTAVSVNLSSTANTYNLQLLVLVTGSSATDITVRLPPVATSTNMIVTLRGGKTGAGNLITSSAASNIIIIGSTTGVSSSTQSGTGMDRFFSNGTNWYQIT